MLNSIPGKEEMTALIGNRLYEVWDGLCALIEESYDMERLWIKAKKRGRMSINTGEEAKPCAHCMQGKTAWVLWLSLAGMSA